MLPKGQLQAQRDGGQGDRHPGVRLKQKGVFVLNQKPLLFQAVMRQQRHRARQRCQRQ